MQKLLWMRTEIVYETSPRDISAEMAKGIRCRFTRRGGAATKKRNIYHGDTEKTQSENLNTEDTGEASEHGTNLVV
jgi:hypothetical protein